MEVSGKDTLVFKGSVDTRANNGKTGLLLLDPANITIANGIGDSTADGDTSTTSFSGVPSGVPSGVTGTVITSDNPVGGTLTLYESELEGIAATTNISLAATNAITINNLTDNNLNLKQGVGNSVSFNSATFSMNTGDIITTAGGAINISTTGAATIGGLAANGGAVTLNVGGASSVRAISGTGTSLTKQGIGTLTLSAANSYTGATNINAGTLALGNNNLIADTSAVSVVAGATFSLGNFAETIGSLAGAGTVTKSGATARTLAVGGNNASTTFSGVIQQTGAGALSLTKNGTGTLTLSGTNTYTGTTTISAGTLAVSGGSAIADTSQVNLANTAGAALNLAGNETIGNLSGGARQAATWCSTATH